jgi:hypothetical protein
LNSGRLKRVNQSGEGSEYRNAFYGYIAEAITDDGLFIDKILTKPIPFIPLSKLIEKYKNLDVDNQNVNSFNCEVLFCSELLNNDQNIVDTTMFYDKLRSLNITRISEFVEACHEITPSGCTWWYSIDWDVERRIYEKYWNITHSFNEPDTSEYFDRAKLLVSTRRSNNEKRSM